MNFSIITPIYNESENIVRFLRAIESQDFPKSQFEVILIDDNSTDDTVDLIKQFKKRTDLNIKIYLNGEHICERGKSIGLEKSRFENILLLDADNILPSKNWFKEIIKPFKDNKNLFASYSVYFKYSKNDTIANRWCALYGVNDPLQYYCNRQDRLGYFDKKWNLGGRIIKNTNRYFIIDLYGTNNRLTLGTIGFLAKKKPYIKYTSWKPYFFHVDATHEAIDKGYSRFAMVKNSIEHLHSKTVNHLILKLKRNIELYYEHESERKNNWAMDDKTNLLLAILMMATLVVPIYDALKGYFFKKKDVAWLIHPYICFRTTIIYSIATIKKLVGKFR